ncbi:MAG: PDZ domain-containing protein, partial [Clostridia bacterium]|nr:PDZ domain-containing protein [Clostridia bacterium]
ALFLLFSFLLCSFFALPLSAEDTEDEGGLTLEQYIAVTQISLKAALTKKADALEAEGDAESATLLRGYTFHVFRIALVDIYYSQVYVKTHESASALATEMVDLLVEYFYLDKLTTPELVTDALVLCYARAVGDEYASYANEESYVASGEEETEYVGIGVTVELLADGYAKIIEVANGSPAEEAGLRLGDIIVAVEGVDFALLGYDNAVSKIRGEEGTEVTLTVKRGDTEISFTMTRKKMSIRTVSFHVMEESDEKIGYIRISKFDETTFSQFVEAVESLEEKEVSAFVFDVRQNPGGRLDVIIAILEYLLPDNTGAPIVRLKYRYQTHNITSILDYLGSDEEVESYGYTAALQHSVDKKMTVLCDAYTVSAAELFTSCLKDFGVAEVFGSATYGKGMGQSEITLPYSYEGVPLLESDPHACIRISTFYYSPPVSGNYEGVGVLPHHTVSLFEEFVTTPIADLTYETDLALQAAVAFIESGAPLTQGKVDLTSKPNGGDGSGSSTPSKPSQKPTPPTNITPPKTERGPIYVLCFWIVFSLSAALAVGLVTVGAVKRVGEAKRVTPSEGEGPTPSEEDTTEGHNPETNKID